MRTLSVLLLVLTSCAQPGSLVVQRQVTGGLDTNCYLLYDSATKEAALFDVGGPIDSLLTTIASERLSVRYLFCTHGHFDHILGLPAIRDSFPDALVCIHGGDLEDMPHAHRWMRENLDPDLLTTWGQDPELRKILEFDVALFGDPDVYVEDGQQFTVGSFEITAIHSPGHSRGCVCYHVDNILFSGDVLFEGSVGSVNLLGGSREHQINSVRRLYRELSGDVVVYPGHGDSTRIGIEKLENTEITVNEVYL